MSLSFLHRSRVIYGALALAIALSSCDGGGEEKDLATPTAPDMPVSQTQGEPLRTDTTDQTTLDAGSYCYRTETKTLQAIAEFLVEPNNSVTGTLEATVTDEANSYYTSYDQQFAGVLDGDTFNTSITTNIEDDVQKSTETWTLNDKQLSSDSAIFLKRVDCEEIIAIKANRKAVSQPSPKATAPTPKPSTAPVPSQPTSTPPAAPKPKVAQTPPQKSPAIVQFSSGSTTTVLQGQLGAKQQQVYLLNATEGQDMRIEITNKSGAANFDVEVDNGEVIEEQLAEYIDFTLPFSGQYIITVNAGNAGANYDLAINIQ
ncbi:MAG: hypothetical protein HC799_05970 [Limnothrix sp. RL_2_0]|nr:hypothetical protein [Limnothrix sp. RL_2_0]